MGAKSLAVALKKNNTLNTLILGTCARTLERNHIGDDGATSIASALKDNSGIRTLNLSYNNIHIEGAKQVALMLEINQALTSLDFGTP